MGDGNDCRKYTYKCSSLIIDYGGQVYRTILEQAVVGYGSIPEFLKAKKDLITGTKIYNDQVKILYPNGTAALSADKFDITLLANILDKLGQPKTESVLKDLKKLKQYRNELMHIADTRTAFDETSFKKMWDKIAEVIESLGTTYDIPNLKTDINKLLNDPLDSKREEELQNEIERLKRTMKDWNDVEIAGVTALYQEEVKDVMPKEYFQKTTQYNEAKQALENYKIIVLNGAPGEGKTTMAKTLVTEVSKRSCVKLTSGSDWKYISSKVDAVLIDDMFGAGIFDKEECRQWQKLLPTITQWVQDSEHARYVVITSRTYILEEALKQLFLKNHFTEKNICTLYSYKLSPEDKVSLLKNHFAYAKKDIDKTDLALFDEISKLQIGELGPAFTVGFPECARLFASNENLQKGGTKFFEQPMTHILKCVSEICQKPDVFVAFFVLWAQPNRRIRSRDLELPVQATPVSIKDPILKIQYRPQDHLRMMREEMYNHVQKAGFIRLDEEEQFQFSHDIVRDAVGLIAFKRNRTAVLSLCDKEFINTYIHISSASETNATKQKNQKGEVSEFTISLPPSRFDQLSLRVAILVIPESITTQASDLPVNEESLSCFLKNPSIFLYGIFESEDFCSAFITSIREKNGYLKTLLTTPIRRISSVLIEYRFNALEKVNTEVRLFSFLLWRNEKVTFLARQCFQEIMKYPAVLQQELFIALIIACAVGSNEIAQFIVTNGGQIDSLMILMAYDNVIQQQLATNKVNQTDSSEQQSDKQVLLNLLLEKSNFPDSAGYFPIHLAALEGRTDIVREILWQDPSQAEIRFTSDEKGLTGVSLYHIAVDTHNLDLVELLLRHKIQANVLDSENRTPFLYAIYNGKIRIARKLQQNGKGNEMIPDVSNNTPLHIAITKSSNFHFKKMALELCKQSTSNLHLKNASGQSPLYLAFDSSSSHIVKELLKKEPDFLRKEQTLLHDLVKSNNIDAIELLLNYDFDKSMLDEQNRTPLKLAEELGHWRIVDLLRTKAVEKIPALPLSVKEFEPPEIDDDKENMSDDAALDDENPTISDSTSDN